MNRELKFRVWDKLAKKLIYLKGSHDAIAFRKTGEAFYINYESGDGENEYILQQFTGLKDSGGKEIYEGDILKLLGQARKFVVTFDEYSGDGYYDEKHYGWICREISGGDEKTLPDVLYSEIVGNIFESPELFKECEPIH